MKYYSEKVDTSFSGTIIDFETIGEFSSYRDSRAYKDLTPVMVGALFDGEMHIHYVEKKDEIQSFHDELKLILAALPRPWYAFNCDFEQGVTFHSLGLTHEYDHELNARKYEGKGDCRVNLGLSNYDDPFNDIGKLFPKNWLKGKIGPCLKHNRACLLKERDILMKRGHREPEKLKFIPF